MKKINSCIAGISIFTLIGHIFLTMRFLLTGLRNELVSNIFARTTYALLLLHIVLSIVIMIRQRRRGVGAAYPKQRIRVILQRGSGLAILLLLHGHIFKMVDVLHHKEMLVPDKIKFLAVNLSFFACIMLHIAVSASRIFITFGILTDGKKIERLDRIIQIVCAIGMVAISTVLIHYIIQY